MKKFLSLILLFASCTSLFAFSLFGFNPKKATMEKMEVDVSKKLEHTLEPYEKNIVDVTYKYYRNQFDGDWTEENWNTAVDKCVELCNDKAVIVAAKTGKFGEKFLQALIVTGEDVWSGFNDWVNKKSSEYELRHE